jgi:hypothetical protein
MFEVISHRCLYVKVGKIKQAQQVQEVASGPNVVLEPADYCKPDQL